MKKFERVGVRGKMTLKSRWKKWNIKHERTWYSSVGLAFLSAVFYVGLNAAWTIHTLAPKMVPVTVVHAESTPELPMKDWVLSEVEKAGIDKYDAYALIKCESNWNPDARLINYGNQNGVDRGLWQLSDKYQKHVSNSCSYDYKCATSEAIKIIKKQGFKPWVCSKKLGL